MINMIKWVSIGALIALVGWISVFAGSIAVIQWSACKQVGRQASVVTTYTMFDGCTFENDFGAERRAF